MFKSLFGGRKKRPPESSTLVDSIKDARGGDVFTVSGLSIEYEESYFIIEKLNRYESSVGQWHEALGADGENKLWLQWSDHGGLHMSVMPDGRPMGLSRLGLDEEQLHRMDEEESIDNSFTYEGTRYYYQFSGEAQYYQDDRGPGEGFYLWEFAGEDDRQLISVNKWEGVPIQGYLSEVVSPGSVTVYKR